MSSSLRVNTIVPSTGTNVAIGTANGTVTFTDSVNFVLGTGSSIFSPASNTLTFGTNDAERLRITSAGGVGIGENNPEVLLHLTETNADPYNTVITHLKLNNGGGNGGSGSRIELKTGAARCWIQSFIDGANSNSGGALVFGTPSSGTLGTERLRITSDGKLGVNVASPGCQTGGIHAVHDATEGTPSFTGGEVGIFQRNYNSAQGCEIGIIGGSNSSSRINFGDKDDADIGIISYSHNDNSMRFIVSAAERLRITSAGLVGIATDAPSSAFLDIATDSGSNDHLRLRRISSDSNVASNWSFKPYAGHLYFREGGSTDKIQFMNGGDVNIIDGNLVVADGHGIDFSATGNSSGSMSSELLDDYEEGTFTPNDASGAGLTFANAAGIYTKVGRMVHVQIRVVYPTTSNTSYVSIGGFPFTATNQGTNISNGANASGFGYFTGSNVPQIHMSASGTHTNLYYLSTIQRNNNLSGRELRFGVVYSAA